MSNKTLGIDLGTNSIGWSIRDKQQEDNQIIDYGVITFDKGVASEKGNEFPKVQKRTESRGKRRNYQAEKYRKWSLLEFLIANNMCPLTIEELDTWRKYRKGQKRKYPSSELFINWLRFDFNGDGKPDFHLFGKGKEESHYIFRTLAIDPNSKTVFDNNPHILGRVFYQLVQQRGFKGRDEEEAKTMLQGSEKAGTPGRNDIAHYIEEHKSLGAALYHYQKEKGGRIRQRYNLRKDYENELKLICNIQGLSEEVYKKLWQAIIWQRPLRTQKGLVGKCIYEKNKSRVQVSHPLYEEYRTWVFINNLKIVAPKGENRIEYIKNNIYSLFYRASNDFKLEVIINQLKKDGADMQSRFGAKTKVVSATLLNEFNKLFGEDWRENLEWNNIHQREHQPKKKTKSGYTFEDVWHILNTFDGQENLIQFATEKLGFTEEDALKFSKIKLKKGYATLSLSAIKKVLPFLRRGMLYSQAVYLANLYKVLGAEKITDDLINYFAEEVENIIEKNKNQKLFIQVVNGLINDEINNEKRYSIENDRALDDAEMRLVHQKIEQIIGADSWENNFTEDEKQTAVAFISEEFRKFLKKSHISKHNSFIQQPRLHEQIWHFIKETYDVSDVSKKHLWHPSEQEAYEAAQEFEHFVLNGKNVFISENQRDTFIAKNSTAEHQGVSLKLLGSPEPISKGFKNPMALKTLHKLKQLINYLLQVGKIDESTRIVVEIARELNDANKRRAIERWQNAREVENDKNRKVIDEYNEANKSKLDRDSKVLLKKLWLWKEQNKKCLYTCEPIKISDILNGENFDIEHTIPASISFDSELKNLTLSDVDFNRNIKGKKFPAQLSNYETVLKNIETIFGKRTVELKKDKKGNAIQIEKWARIEDLELQYKEWKNKASFASTKDYKDFCIQKYHMIKMDLNYMRAKLKTFTLTEYKDGWRNSQLRDTQIVTKYALPYLKTVFKKVSVEKGTVVDIFKEIYAVKLTGTKKDRSVHSHHAQDAAILTLIPPFYQRDKILKEYFELKDKKTNKVYHQKPKDYYSFKASHILEIENEVLINNLTEHKTTLHTYKRVRKRGKIEWLNKEKGIAKIAQGDTVRGQLHGESIYGAIKPALRNDKNQILFDDNGKMQLAETPTLVIRKPFVYKKDANSPGFKNLAELEKVIVNKDLFKMIAKQVAEFPDFKTALSEGIYMLNKKGEKVNDKIRHIRCFERLKFNSAVKVSQHDFKSEKDYKNFALAQNKENPICLFYKNEIQKGIYILSIGEIAVIKLKNENQFFTEPHFNSLEIGKGKKTTTIPLYSVLKSGLKAILYKNSLEELKHLSQVDLSKRLFKMTGFENDGRINFKHHMIAGNDTDLKKLYKVNSAVDLSTKQVFLRLTKAHWNFAIEGKDFEIKLDGSVKFKF